MSRVHQVTYTKAFVIQLTAIKGKQEHLQNTERSSSEVEEDVTDAPTHSALPAEVHHSLSRDIEN